MIDVFSVSLDEVVGSDIVIGSRFANTEVCFVFV